jgi:hypothetical protein
MKILTPWIDGDGCAYRLLSGAADKSCNRVAFISKTQPRVKLLVSDYSICTDKTDALCVEPKRNAWLFGPPGSYDDLESRDWCDSMLNLLGYEDEPPIPIPKKKLREFRNKYLLRC